MLLQCVLWFLCSHALVKANWPSYVLAELCKNYNDGTSMCHLQRVGWGVLDAVLCRLGLLMGPSSSFFFFRQVGNDLQNLSIAFLAMFWLVAVLISFGVAFQIRAAST